MLHHTQKYGLHILQKYGLKVLPKTCNQITMFTYKERIAMKSHNWNNLLTTLSRHVQNIMVHHSLSVKFKAVNLEGTLHNYLFQPSSYIFDCPKVQHEQAQRSCMSKMSSLSLILEEQFYCCRILILSKAAF